MFELLRDAGRYLAQTSPIQQLTEPLGDQYHYGVAICFDRGGTYVGVQLVSGTKGVLYKSGPSGGSDFTLVSRHSGKTENVVKRLLKNANAIVETGEESETDLIRKCVASTKDRVKEMADQIENRIPEDAGIQKRVYVFWALRDGNELLGFHTRKEVQEHLAKAVFERYGSKRESKLPLKAAGRTCCVCGKPGKEVYGNFTDIACYNLDKPGMITGGFQYSRAPANFPICGECILYVLAGKTFAEQHLTFRLAGLNYWLLPQTFDMQLYKVLLERIRESEDRQTLGKQLATLTDDEKEIFRYITQETAVDRGAGLLTLNMIFYEAKQASWRIMAEIREVLPSRIRALFEAKNWVEKNKHEEMVLSKRERENGYSFTLKTVRPFCGAIEKQSDCRFLSYLEAIFKGRCLDPRGVLNDLAEGIIKAQKKDPNNSRFTVRDAWAIYLFLSRIGVLNAGGDIMEKVPPDNQYGAFLNENAAFFVNIYRQAAFLTGCYVGALLYVQNERRKSQPFARKFMGRKLNGRSLRSLFTQAETKLRQYEALGVVHQLAPRVAEAWVRCGEDWGLGEDETTFAFSLGVTLQQKLATKKEKTSMEVKV